MAFTSEYNLLHNGQRAWMIQASDEAGWNWDQYLTKPIVTVRDQWGGPNWITSAPSLKRVREEMAPGDAVFCYQAAPEKAIVGLARVSSFGYSRKGERSVSRFDLDWGMRVGPLPYDALANDRHLSRCEKVRFAEGTVFRLSEPECLRILELLDLSPPQRRIVESRWKLSVPAALPLAPSPDQDKLPKRVKVEISRCIRDTALARELKARYDHTCQLCGTRITLPNGEGYSEAHHVRPLSLAHRGHDRRDNVIVLCPTHHVEFDYGVLALTPNGRHVIHLDTRDDVHRAKVHYERGHVLASDVLKYHRRRIFGRSS